MAAERPARAEPFEGDRSCNDVTLAIRGVSGTIRHGLGLTIGGGAKLGVT